MTAPRSTKESPDYQKDWPEDLKAFDTVPHKSKSLFVMGKAAPVDAIISTVSYMALQYKDMKVDIDSRKNIQSSLEKALWNVINYDVYKKCLIMNEMNSRR